MVVRYLEYARYRVTFVKNYTDVDDKIIARANQLKVPIRELTERHIQAYEGDMGKLGAPAALSGAPATDHVPEMVALIERLVASGVAYVVDGDVYFEVLRFPAYGRLSGRTSTSSWRGPGSTSTNGSATPDFALWKTAKPDEPSWPSLGVGARPARLAYRVLRDGDEVPRRDAASARRGGGPDLSPPLVRDRPVRGRDRSRSRGSGCTTASSTSGPRRCPSRWGIR